MLGACTISALTIGSLPIGAIVLGAGLVGTWYVGWRVPTRERQLPLATEPGEPAVGA